VDQLHDVSKMPSVHQMPVARERSSTKTGVFSNGDPLAPCLNKRCRVINGFRIEMTADELIRHLDARIAHHHAAASECETKRIRFEAVGSLPDDEESEDLGVWPGYGAELERRVEGHKRKQATLAFLRNHVIAHEIYRLGEHDLRLLELWPHRSAVDSDG
jgi:hypothetical protein